MVRSFTGEPLPPGALDAVLAAARRAPSAGYTQATEVVVLEHTETDAYWAASFPDTAARARFRWQGLFQAPALVVVVTRPAAYVERYAAADKAGTGLGAAADSWSVPYWWVDAGMAVMAALLAATAGSIGAIFFGLFERERAVLDALGVPHGYRAVGTIALGVPAPADEPGRSAVTRPRRPAADTVHRGRW